MDVYKAIGRNIQRVRKSHDMDAEPFAEAMTKAGHKMSVTTVSRLENGHRGMGVGELLAAAHVLGTSPLALVIPPEGEGLEFGDVPAVDGATLRDWWTHMSHPRQDVADDDMPHEGAGIPRSPRINNIIEELNDYRAIMRRLRFALGDEEADK